MKILHNITTLLRSIRYKRYSLKKYDTWDLATKDCRGYDNPEILNKLKQK